LVASVFSHTTALPAAMAARQISRWLVLKVNTQTASTPGSARISR